LVKSERLESAEAELRDGRTAQRPSAATAERRVSDGAYGEKTDGL
jgi:hypothetical protein